MLRLLLASVLLFQTGQAVIPTDEGPVVGTIGIQIFGEVTRPGTYYLSMPTMPDLIAAAGGFTDKANRRAIVWRRPSFQQHGVKPMIVDYDDREGTGKVGPHIWNAGVRVWAGDSIEVPAK